MSLSPASTSPRPSNPVVSDTQIDRDLSWRTDATGADGCACQILGMVLESEVKLDSLLSVTTSATGLPCTCSSYKHHISNWPAMHVQLLHAPSASWGVKEVPSRNTGGRSQWRRLGAVLKGNGRTLNLGQQLHRRCPKSAASGWRQTPYKSVCTQSSRCTCLDYLHYICNQTPK